MEEDTWPIPLKQMLIIVMNVYDFLPLFSPPYVYAFPLFYEGGGDIVGLNGSYNDFGLHTFLLTDTRSIDFIR